MKFGCCISRTADIAKVQAAGYDYFEFAGKQIALMDQQEFAHMREEAGLCGLPCIGFNSYCGETPAIVGEAFDPEAAAAYAEMVCVRGRQLGIRSIGIGAPAARRLPKNYPAERARQQCEAFLTITAAAAERHGIRLLFEAVHDRACDFAVHTEEAAQMVRRLALPNLAVVLDFYHMQVMGERLEDAACAIPWLKHTHVSTCGPERQRGYPQEEERERYEGIFRWLKTHGYDRTLSIEADSFDFEEAAASLKMLRDIDLKTGLQAEWRRDEVSAAGKKEIRRMES